MKNITKAFALCLIITLCSFATEWIPVQNAAGKFKAMFPREPKESVQTVNTDIGELTMNILMYEVGKFKDDNAAYAVIYCDYPDTLVNSDFKDEILDRFFKSTIDGAVKNVQGQLLSADNTSITGYPGRQVKVGFAEGAALMYIKIYLVKNRMYFLQVACEKDKDKNPSIDKFMNSFALVTK